MLDSIDRREFIKSLLVTSGAALSVIVNPFKGLPLLGAKEDIPDLVMVKGGTPKALVQKALVSMGGMDRFVSRGDIVVVKPNIGWDRLPEQGANTNPEVVETVVRMCIDAGAKKVKVFDRPCDDPRRCYAQSGIENAVRSAGGEIYYVDERKFREVNIGGEILKKWPMYTEVLEADKVINVPVAKHHSLTRVTLALKNWMGVMGGNRSLIHQKIDQSLADLTLLIKPSLTILDATRILLRNGPSGGNVHDVKKMDVVVAGIDQVAVDSLGASFFGIKGEELGFLRIAEKMGKGTIDYKKLRFKSIEL
ncbi:MAG: DUF362 domain-containing protein [Proteobacteria bacterium]|nr:DUF362 domain-containing protein [Pseudomonadota bacterium]